MLIRRMRCRSYSRPAWYRLTEINVHLELSSNKLSLFCCERLNRLKILSWRWLKYLILSDSNKISFQLCVCDRSSKLLWLRRRWCSLSYTYFLSRCFVNHRNFSLIYELVVSTSCVFLVLLSKCKAIRLFVHARSTRRYQILLLLLFVFGVWSSILELILFVPVIVCSKNFVKIDSFVVHLVKVSKLFGRLLKMCMFLNFRLRLGWKFD